MDLTVGVGHYDRTRPLLDGRVGIEGATLEFVDEPLEAIFTQAFTDAPFEISELSFSNFVRHRARGWDRYVGLPVFPSRSFRHGAIYVRAEGGVTTPDDLRGARVGVREYTNTVALVVRGFLAEDHGVQPTEVDWYVGDVDEVERSAIPVPEVPGVSVTPVVGEELSSWLAAGRLDALIDYRPPRGVAEGSVTRLFPDHRQVEEESFARTGRFPIMHLVGVRRDVLDGDPTLAPRIVRAFTRAKELAFEELFEQQALKVSLPWAVAEAERTASLLGEDFWPYGVERNRSVLEAQLRYAWEQGLTERQLAVDEVVHADGAIEEAARPSPGDAGGGGG